jgi:hypothetical protein
MSRMLTEFSPLPARARNRRAYTVAARLGVDVIREHQPSRLRCEHHRMSVILVPALGSTHVFADRVVLAKAPSTQSPIVGR